MKKMIKSAACAAQHLAILTAGVILMALSACSGSGAGDARDLLSTVPSDVAAVAVVNVKSMLDHTGFESSGSELKAPEVIASKISAITDDKVRADIEALLKGDTGVAHEAAVVFYAEQPYITLLLDDPAKTKTFLESHENLTLSEEDGVTMASNFAIKGNQLWIAVMNIPQPAMINSFAQLTEKQSYLSSDYSETLLSMKHDVEAIADIQAMMRIMLTTRMASTSDVATFSMFSSILFENPDYLSMTLDMDAKKGMTTTFGLLTDKFKPARYLLPIGKISESTVADLGGKAQVVGALDLPSNLIEKVQKAAASLGGTLPSSYLDIIRPIDGTTAYAGMMSSNDFRVIVTTDGKQTSALQNLLSSLFGNKAEVSRQEKQIRVEAGDINPAGPGVIEVKEGARLLKGSLAGIVINSLSKEGKPVQNVILLKSSGDGVVLTIEMKGTLSDILSTSLPVSASSAPAEAPAELSSTEMN